tara:strand:+ start:814 stop:1014 length:201 start_codon:yes stop_codon:yes gene_type:complete
MDNIKKNRRGQKCEHCGKPLRTTKADREYGFQWKRKYHRKCVEEAQFFARLREEYENINFNKNKEC